MGKIKDFMYHIVTLDLDVSRSVWNRIRGVTLVVLFCLFWYFDSRDGNPSPIWFYLMIGIGLFMFIFTTEYLKWGMVDVDEEEEKKKRDTEKKYKKMMKEYRNEKD